MINTAEVMLWGTRIGIIHMNEANGVVKFCQMEDCRLEKETKQWVWLSYYNCYTHNQRVTQKFRNVYDFSFIRR